MCADCGDSYPVPARREYRRRMNHLTVRKITAVQRIEINRFWNELEEIFDRLEEVKEEYNCSTIEEAENILNETVECDHEVESFVAEENFCWCKQTKSDTSYEEDNVSCYCSDASSSAGRSSSKLSQEDSQDDFVSFQSQYDL